MGARQQGLEGSATCLRWGKQGLLCPDKGQDAAHRGWRQEECGHTHRRLRAPSRRMQQAGSQGRGRTGVDASVGASIMFLPPAKSEEGARGLSSPAENRLHTAFLAGQSELVIRSNTSHFLAA